MNNVILSIDDHLGVIPSEYELNDAATYMAIVFGWAYEGKYLSDFIYKSELYKHFYLELSEQKLAIDKFVINCLDGKICEEHFTEEVREFVYDYITSGVFYRQVCDFFEVKNVYALPKDWHICAAFFVELEEHFTDVKCNY